MADFLNALAKIIKHEGGYVNDPTDNGGETYKGICRKNYPNSSIWDEIDKCKEKYNGDAKKINNALKHNETINSEIESIYKENYWDKFDLDNNPKQAVAEEIFDDAVNRGVAAVCKILSVLFGIQKTTKPTKEIKNKLNNI